MAAPAGDSRQAGAVRARLLVHLLHVRQRQRNPAGPFVARRARVAGRFGGLLSAGDVSGRRVLLPGAGAGRPASDAGRGAARLLHLATGQVRAGQVDGHRTASGLAAGTRRGEHGRGGCRVLRDVHHVGRRRGRVERGARRGPSRSMAIDGGRAGLDAAAGRADRAGDFQMADGHAGRRQAEPHGREQAAPRRDANDRDRLADARLRLAGARDRFLGHAAGHGRSGRRAAGRPGTPHRRRGTGRRGRLHFANPRRPGRAGMGFGRADGAALRAQRGDRFGRAVPPGAASVGGRRFDYPISCGVALACGPTRSTRRWSAWFKPRRSGEFAKRDRISCAAGSRVARTS